MLSTKSTIISLLIIILIYLFIPWETVLQDRSRVIWQVPFFQRKFWHGYCDAPQPLVSGNLVVATGGYFWDDLVFIIAVDQLHGKELWRSGPFSKVLSPVVGEGIYFALLVNDGDGWGGHELAAFNINDGKKLWKMPHIQSFRFHSGKLYALQSANSRTGLYDLLELDQNKGVILHQVDELAVGPDYNLWSIDSGQFTFIDVQGRLQQHDLKSRRIRSSKSFGSRPESFLSKQNFSFFSTRAECSECTQRNFIVYDNISSAVILNLSFKDKVYISQAGTYVFFFGTIEERKGGKIRGGDLYAFDTISQKIAWKLHFDSALSPTILLEGQRLLLRGTNYAAALDILSGDLLWKTDLSFSMWTPLAGVVVDGRWFTSHDHSFYALDTNTGSIVWKFITSEHTDSPIYHDGVMYGGSDNCSLYALQN